MVNWNSFANLFHLREDGGVEETVSPVEGGAPAASTVAGLGWVLCLGPSSTTGRSFVVLLFFQRRPFAHLIFGHSADLLLPL